MNYDTQQERTSLILGVDTPDQPSSMAMAADPKDKDGTDGDGAAGDATDGDGAGGDGTDGGGADGDGTDGDGTDGDGTDGGH